MIHKIVPILLATSLLLGEEAPLTNNQLSSTNASYDGNALILQGRVHLDHGLGNMSADQAFLQKQETGKDFPFSLIQLKKEVLLSLKNKAELRCDIAELDFNELKGALSSEEKVSYKDFLKKEGSSLIPFYLMSKLIDLQFVKQEAPTEAAQYGIHSLVAKKEVQIEYAKEFLLQADEASYHSNDDQNNKLSGTIQAYPTSAASKCRLFYQGENTEADLIHIDIKNSQIQIKKPSGSIPSQLFGQNQITPLLFHSDNLLWDHEKETLLLQDQVTIQESTLGSLYAEKEMLITQGKNQNKKFVKSVHIEGVSRLEHQDLSSGWQHKLSCFGSLHIDGLKGQITLTSPQEKNKQLCYQDQEVILQANKALIEYSEASDYKPLSLTLQGNVTIKSALTSGPLRLGLADRLTYSPDTQTVILSALPKKRVLFQDEEQNITMSAQEVHLTKDSTTGKMQVKGIGNVKFSLSTEENDLLKNRFFFKSEEKNVTE